MENNNKLIKALINIQSKIGVIPKKEKGQTGNRSFKYADLPAIWEKLQPLLEENNIFFSQQITSIEKNVFVVSKAYHESGECMESSIEIFHIPQDIKQFGGLISYYRRYATVCFFGLVCDEEEVENKDIKIENINLNQSTAKNTIVNRQITKEEFEILLLELQSCERDTSTLMPWLQKRGFSTLDSIDLDTYSKILKSMENPKK
jgi:hypothetical protein